MGGKYREMEMREREGRRWSEKVGGEIEIQRKRKKEHQICNHIPQERPGNHSNWR